MQQGSKDGSPKHASPKHLAAGTAVATGKAEHTPQDSDLVDKVGSSLGPDAGRGTAAAANQPPGSQLQAVDRNAEEALQIQVTTHHKF